jgi:hypothetical protein
MDLTKVSRLRSLAGWAGALFAFIVLAALLDGLIARFREPVNLFHVLAGATVEIDGHLGDDLRDLKDLRYTSSTEHLEVTFLDLHRGYFLGGNMWRGQCHVSPATPPGKHTFAVHPRQKTASTPPAIFRVVVYADYAGLRPSFRSLLQRYLDVSPWLAAALCLPFLGLSFALVFLCSQKIDTLLAEAGKAEIYKVSLGEGYALVTFGLGTKNGVQPGCQLTITTPEGQVVGSLEVREAMETDALGITSQTQDIRPGYYVSLPGK